LDWIDEAENQASPPKQKPTNAMPTAEYESCYNIR